MSQFGFRGMLVAMTAAAAIGAVACGGSGGDNDDSGAGDFTANQAEQRDAVAPSGESQSAGGSTASGVPPKSSGDGSQPSQVGSLDRKIIFSGSMTLAVEDVAGTFDRVSRVARDAGGFVEKSSFNNSDGQDDGRESASLTLRVPVAQYEGVLASLRGLPDVSVKKEGAQSTEVTEQYTDLQSRLRNLERAETQYLDLLAKATTINDILTVTDRLDGVRLQIEQIQGRLQVLDDLTEMASVDISIVPPAAAKSEPSEGPKSFARAFQDAWEGSLEAARYVANAGAVVLVAAVWLVIPLGLIVLGNRWLRRNRDAAASS